MNRIDTGNKVVFKFDFGNRIAVVTRVEGMDNQVYMDIDFLETLLKIWEEKKLAESAERGAKNEFKGYVQ